MISLPDDRAPARGSHRRLSAPKGPRRPRVASQLGATLRLDDSVGGKDVCVVRYAIGGFWPSSGPVRSLNRRTIATAPFVRGAFTGDRVEISGVTVSECHPPRDLYDPNFEHDACGVGFVADLRRGASHEVVELGLTALENLRHRGAFGADPQTGDGAGILVQMPDRFFRSVLAFDLPPTGAYASGMMFLPKDERIAEQARQDFSELAAEEGLRILGWRSVPVNLEVAGSAALAVAPDFAQVVVAADTSGARPALSGLGLERAAYVLRKRFEHVHRNCYLPSLSTRTFVYKGMLATEQLRRFFPDLSDERFESALALFHSRFSTNTFPSWPLAHPYRVVAAQWRDQHDHGEQELDARPRGTARDRSHPW